MWLCTHYFNTQVSVVRNQIIQSVFSQEQTSGKRMKNYFELHHSYKISANFKMSRSLLA
ncbi:hypothetical protein CSC23_0776 [Escherichia coli]|nr:hypothetical protein CSC11_0779 [Escherichia coli]AWF14886.1 hypothetical protein CSC23_0776 [Escherichia coli]